MIKYQIVIWKHESRGSYPEDQYSGLEDCGPVFDTLAEASVHLEALMHTPHDDVFWSDGTPHITYGQYLIEVIDEDRRARLEARDRAIDEAEQRAFYEERLNWELWALPSGESTALRAAYEAAIRRRHEKTYGLG